MKKCLFLLFGLAVTIGLFAQKVLPKPDPVRFVTDNANVLSQDEKDRLEEKLKALSDSSSNQIVVVLIPTLGDNDIEEYAHTLFRSWGIGQKKMNNGVLILSAINDHKIRVEVGLGLEGAIPDVTAKDIIATCIKPSFKESKYFEGLDSGTTALSKAAVGEYDMPVASVSSKNSSSTGSMVPLFIFIGIFGTLFITIVIIVIRAAARGGLRSSSSSNDSSSFYSSSSSDSDSSSSSSDSSSDFGGGDSGGGGASDSW